MAVAVAQLLVKVGADTGEAEDKLETLSAKLRKFGAKSAVAGGLLTAGITTPLLGVAKTALNTAADYQSAMNIMQAVSGATNEQMARVAETAKRLGADMTLPATSAGDAARAMTELAKAGLSVNDTLAAAKGVLQLAAAGNLSEAQAAEIASNALNAFRLSGERATDIADLLAAAANASSGEVNDMADSLKMAAAVFASANIPIEELVASIGQMGNAGIKGSDAGTSLKQMLLSLQAPSQKAAKLMAGLGITIYDAQGRMLPFGNIIGQFSTKLAGLSQEQRNAALATIFGADAVRAANIVLMGGVEAHQRMYDAVTRQGAAAELAGARMRGLDGAVKGLKSQVETMLLDVAEPFLGVLEGWTRKLADLVGGLTNLDPKLRNAALAFGAVLAAAGPVLLIVGALSAAVGFLLSPLGLVVAAVAAFAAAFTSNFLGIADLTNQVIGQIVPLIVAGFQQVVSWVQSNWPLIQQTIRTVLANVQAVIQTILGIILDVWAKRGDALLTDVKRIMDGVLTAVQAVLQTVVPFVIGQLTVIITWVQTNWPLIQQTIETVLNTILLVVTAILDQILLFWQAHGEQVMTIVQTAWDLIATTISTTINAVLGIIRAVMQAINGDWAGAWETLKGVINTVWEGIKTIVKDAVTIVATTLALAWDGIKATAQNAWNDIWNVIKSALNRIVSGINSMIESWNRLRFEIPGFSVEIPSVDVPGVGRVGGGHLGWPGIKIETPDIPKISLLAAGGIVTRPAFAVLGEAGPEAVIPLGGSRLDALAERIADAVAKRPTYTINAQYAFRDERDLMSDLRLIQLLGAA